MLVAILVTVLLGALVGWLASKLTNRDGEQGALENILVGVAGAMVATLILSGFTGTDPFISLDLGDVFAAFLGAVLVCVALNLMQRKRIR